MKALGGDNISGRRSHQCRGVMMQGVYLGSTQLISMVGCVVAPMAEIFLARKGLAATTVRRAIGGAGGVLQVRRSMHQDCLLNPRKFVFYPFFTHFSPIFSVWTPGIQGARPEVQGKTGKNREKSGKWG